MKIGKNLTWILSLGAIACAMPGVGQDPPVHAMGYVGEDPSHFSSLPHMRMTARAMAAPRPSSLLLTDHLPPIGNQGGQGSCVAWATAYACFTYGVHKNRKLGGSALEDPAHEFSPAFVYHIGHLPQGGMLVSRAMAILKQYGCCTLKEMPYRDTDDSTAPSPEALAEAAKYKLDPDDTPALLAGLGQKTPDPEEMKAYLSRAKRPFVLAVRLFKDWPQGAVPPDFVYSPTVATTAANRIGGHAMTVVGYDDAKHAFRLANSWTKSWGDNGFIWVSEDYVVNNTLEAWGFRPGGLYARSFVRGKTTDEYQKVGLVVEAPRAHARGKKGNH